MLHDAPWRLLGSRYRPHSATGTRVPGQCCQEKLLWLGHLLVAWKAQPTTWQAPIRRTNRAHMRTANRDTFDLQRSTTLKKSGTNRWVRKKCNHTKQAMYANSPDGDRHVGKAGTDPVPYAECALQEEAAAEVSAHETPAIHVEGCIGLDVFTVMSTSTAMKNPAARTFVTRGTSHAR